MNETPTTKDQKFYTVNGRFKAEIDVCPTRGHNAPALSECRHAALPLGNGGYAVYDRLLGRLVNGVFSDLESAVGVAANYNVNPDALQDMAPGGAALGLIYPTEK